ncbi:MAG: peptide chain release factor N(5)-glutamine methyltransferase [Bacteroides sp.]|jgi:release factor glutamine methyltransferase|nr:peptide chain release factor N(5)-glutamine methyltransferase [Bacteroides sp.]
MISPVTLGSAYQWFLKTLEGTYPEKELQALGREVFRHFFSIEPTERVMNAHLSFPPDFFRVLESVVEQLKQHVPLQYVTGVARFLDLYLDVDPRVLIPRPETEELVQWVFETIQTKFGSSQPGVSLLDVGTGSGCIPVSLAKKLPNARVMACDVSEEVLEVASHNAAKNQVKVDFFRCDVLRDDPQLRNLEVVVSNPPYVMEKEKELMLPNVLEHEPSAALFVSNENPLIFYHAIASKARRWLKPGGFLFFEINENLGKETVECIEKEGFNEVILKRDLNGRHRMIRAVNA